MGFTLEVEFYQVNCSCGGVYAITERVRAYHKEHGTCWTCPYCNCSWGYAGRSEAEKLREQLERQRKLTDSAEASRRYWQENADRAERRRAAQQGATTRIKRRIAGGACPCCNRHFEKLADHMKTKHPDYAESP